MQDLIEKLQKAAGPDRALDCKIWLALFDKQIMIDGGGYGPKATAPKYKSARAIWTDDWPHWDQPSQVDHGVAMELGVPRYTASIDDASTLVLKGWEWAVSSEQPVQSGEARLYGKYDDVQHAICATPAIALSVVALKARLAYPE